MQAVDPNRQAGMKGFGSYDPLLRGRTWRKVGVGLTEDGVAACYPLRETVGGKAGDGS